MTPCSGEAAGSFLRGYVETYNELYKEAAEIIKRAEEGPVEPAPDDEPKPKPGDAPPPAMGGAPLEAMLGGGGGAPAGAPGGDMGGAGGAGGDEEAIFALVQALEHIGISPEELIAMASKSEPGGGGGMGGPPMGGGGMGGPPPMMEGKAASADVAIKAANAARAYRRSGRYDGRPAKTAAEEDRKSVV